MVGDKKNGLFACATVHLVNIALYPQTVAGLHLSPVPTTRKSYVTNTCCEEIDAMNEILSEVDSETRHPGFWGMSEFVDVADLCIHGIGCCYHLGMYMQVNLTFFAVTNICSNLPGPSDPRQYTF